MMVIANLTQKSVCDCDSILMFRSSLLQNINTHYMVHSSQSAAHELKLIIIMESGLDHDYINVMSFN